MVTADKARITASFVIGYLGGVSEIRTPTYVTLTNPVYHPTTAELVPVEDRGVLWAVWR